MVESSITWGKRTMRDKKHYSDMMKKNEGASVSVSLGARAVCASKFGDSDHVPDEDYRKVYRSLNSKYKGHMNAFEVLKEMGCV